MIRDRSAGPEPDMAGPGFALDPFQVEAVAAVTADRNVLVAAPTGSGKTVVAEHAIARSLSQGRRVFYTTPIKALSNQKYADLGRQLGGAQVGLLTGDNSINGEAPVVVMTTEVLRNMLYRASPGLSGLGWVILDEVHFLQDSFRGPVWEEVLIHTPPEVRFVCLSATVSNASELGDWISSIRGPTEVVVEHVRPVELRTLYLVGDTSSETDHLVPLVLEGRPNPEGERFDAVRPSKRRQPTHGGGTRSGRWTASRFRTPRRADVVERLNQEHLLPAIYFIFSRNACNDAADAVLEAGLRFTDRSEADRIEVIAEQHTAGLTERDRLVLGYDRWLERLRHGIAAHHAGLVPAFKEAVEECFALGLVKVVFATETLALGINMPARSVVIEKLTKYTGDGHDLLTPGQFAQLTGRAGRRGIDDVGFAVVLWSPFTSFQQVAGLALSREFPLRSAFRPTYNMTVNLLQRYGRDEALHVLRRSFAQFQLGRDLARLSERLAILRSELATAHEATICELGDAAELHDLTARTHRPKRTGSSARGQVFGSLARLRPGSIISHPIEGHGLVVLRIGVRGFDSVKLRCVDTAGHLVSLSAQHFDEPVHVEEVVDLPRPVRPEERGYRTGVARVLDRRRREDRPGQRAAGRAVKADQLRAAIAAHPVQACPEVRTHLRAVETVRRLGAEAQRLDASVQDRSRSLTTAFDKVAAVLRRWGYLDGWTVTERGKRLSRVYHECDLGVVHAVDTGLFDDLDSAEIAALASCFTFEWRSSDPQPPPAIPTRRLSQRVERLMSFATRLRDEGEGRGAPLSRQPNAGFAAEAWKWVHGRPLDEILSLDLSGGDFVRNIKQLVDLLRQVADLAEQRPLGERARAAIDHLDRGVVSAETALTA